MGQLERGGDRPPLDGLGFFHCRQSHTLKAIPVVHPMLLLVVSGTKILSAPDEELRASAGDLLILQGNCVVSVTNCPDLGSGDYLAVAVVFEPEIMNAYRQLDGEAAKDPEPTSGVRMGRASEDLLLSLSQTLDLSLSGSLTPLLRRHRMLEVLLLIARSGLIGDLLQAETSWRQRVASLLADDVHRSWQAREICRRLGVSEASLRRRLREEKTGFRAILEEVRLTSGLKLLQETRWPIGHVADSVGYESQSRFSQRFKMRFGMTPSELRRTGLNA